MRDLKKLMITGVIAGKDGRGLDADQTATRVAALLAARAAGATEAPAEPELIRKPREEEGAEGEGEEAAGGKEKE